MTALLRRAEPKPRRLPRSTACTSSVRTPLLFPVPYSLSSYTTTPRTIVERRLAMVPHHRGAGAAPPPWLHSARRPHDARRERSTQRWNPAWPRPTSRFGPMWQWATRYCYCWPHSTMLAGRALKPARWP
jgi:hypothetical protein